MTRRANKPTSDWRRHATNVATQVAIYAKHTKEGGALKYRVSNEIYIDFREAALATELYANAALEPIVLQAHWKSALLPFILHSPKGVRLGSFANLREVSNSSAFVAATASKPTADVIERRVAHYKATKGKRAEAVRRAMIDKAKQEIIEDRERAKRLAKFEKEHGDQIGSW